MTQLILDTGGYNVTLPETIKKAYHARKEDVGVEVEMITGRITKELRGRVWRVSYQYGYFDEAMKNAVIAACEKGRETPVICGFLPPDSAEELLYSEFFVTSFTYPKFMWSRTEGEEVIPLWADFSMELREVEPGD